MDKGIYTALSGGIAKAHEIEIIANNLANVNTPGFKRDTGTFHEYLTELRRPDSVGALSRETFSAAMPDARPTGDKSFVELDAVYTDFSQGTVARTGRQLDVALDGEGFLEVLTPSGVRYTRAGNLSVSSNGTLVTLQGYPVLGKGEGAAPEQRMVNVGGEDIHVTQEGFIQRGNVTIAQLSVQEFYEPQYLEKAGYSLFHNTDTTNTRPGQTTQVRQGFLEGSNVNPIHEMTRMIEATRSYEAHLQAVKTHQEIDSHSVNEIARIR